MSGEADGNVQVVVRLRPTGSPDHPTGQTCIDDDGRDSVVVTLPHEDTQHVFNFDHVLSGDATQSAVFDALGPGIVENCINGFNSTIFAYGQTGSGKTYTMLGDMHPSSQHRGFVPRLFQLLFRRIAESEAAQGAPGMVHYSVRCSFLEIYNETIADLISPAAPCSDTSSSSTGGSLKSRQTDTSGPSTAGLKIRQNDKQGTYVEGLTDEFVLNVEEVLALLQRGMEQRHMGTTLMNPESSRSHGVLTCTLERHTKSPDGLTHILSSRLNLIDLAGSEQLGKSKSQGDRMKETRFINQSLTALGRVIKELVETQRSGKPGHVPYRDSKLTFLLQDSLGGTAKTTIIANISPAAANVNETLSTLRFAQDARCLRNCPQQNHKTTGRVSALQAEIERLKHELAAAHLSHTQLSAELKSQQHLQKAQLALVPLVETLQERLMACQSIAAQDAALQASVFQVTQEQMRLQQMQAEELTEQLAAAWAAAREAACQQQMLTQQLLAAQEAAKSDAQDKHTLAIRLRATEVRLAHQSLELHNLKQQLTPEEPSDAPPRLLRQRSEVLQVNYHLHQHHSQPQQEVQQQQQQQQSPKAGTHSQRALPADTGAELLALKMLVSELQARLAGEKRARAAEAAAQKQQLQEAMSQARAAKEELGQLLDQMQLQSEAASKQAAELQAARQRAAALEGQLAAVQQQTGQHVMTAARAVVRSLQQLDTIASAQAEALEAHSAAAELGSVAAAQMQAAQARVQVAEAAAQQAAEANKQLEAALSAARHAGEAAQEADAHAAASATRTPEAGARAAASEQRIRAAEESAAAAKHVAKKFDAQLRAAEARAAAAEARAAAAEASARDAQLSTDAAMQKLSELRSRMGQADSALQQMKQASDVSDDDGSVADSVAAELHGKALLTVTAPADLRVPRLDLQHVMLPHLDHDVSDDDSGASTPRQFTPQHTVEAICRAFNLMEKRPFLPLSLALSQAGNIRRAPERMASSDSGDSTPRLPGPEVLHELSPEVTSKIRRALGNISNVQGPPPPTASREVARLPCLSGHAVRSKTARLQHEPVTKHKSKPPPAAGSRGTNTAAKPPAGPPRAIGTAAKPPAGALAGAVRRTASHESRNLLDMFHLKRDLTRKRGQRNMAAGAPPTDAGKPL